MSKIYEPRGRAREYSPFALNYFKGCDHGCQYCYVPRMMKVFSGSYVHENVSCVNLSGLRKEAARFRASKDGDKQVLLSFTGDPYCKAESGETWRVLKALLDNNIHVSILTKNPGKAFRDIDIISGFDHIKIGATLTCYDDAKSREWEPGAPTSRERIEGLRVFAESGIKTWASLEPVLYPEESLSMIKEVAGFIDHVKIGKINNHPREHQIDWEAFLISSVNLCRDLGIKFYIKDDLAKFGSVSMFDGKEREKDGFNV